MVNFSSNIRRTFTTFSSLPSAGWQLARMYNPEVARILCSNGFSHSEAVGIASNRDVRTFSGKLRRGSNLFRLGVGSAAISDLEKAGLICQTSAGLLLHSRRPNARNFLPAFAGIQVSQSSARVPASILERNYVLSTGSGQATSASASVRRSGGIPGQISQDLINARNLYAQNRPEEAGPLIERAMADAIQIISRGVSPDDPILPCYYAAKLMGKFLKIPGNYGQADPERRDVAQILLLDHTRSQALLQKRGAFKRQFPGCYCVSANTKLKGGQDINEAAAAAVKDEVGIDIDPGKLEMIGQRGQYENHLTSFNFYAFSDEEEQLLLQALEELGDSGSIFIQYDTATRCLTVFTVDRAADRAVLEQAVERVRVRTGIPPIFSFTNTDSNSLLVYQMDEQEEAAARASMEKKDNRRAAAESRLLTGANKSDLKDLDSDQMLFVPWAKVRCDSQTNPEQFTLVLTGPYFPNDEVWAAMGCYFPEVLNIDHPMARLSCVSGGKGGNTNILREILRDEEGVLVPETSELTTFVYEQLVLSDPEIRADIDLLDREQNEDTARAIAERIRVRILAVELPETLRQKIEEEFKRLGCDIAVRSSATTEDMKKHQAAGQAQSCLHLIDIDEAFKSIKTVLSSLFLDGFVSYRKDMKYPNILARMAVLLQKFYEGKAAGVIFSFDQATERPAYRISAQPGVGEGVVEGEGLSDRWLVGCLCDRILQKHIPVKQVRVVAMKEGGVRREAINMSEPSIDDAMVLKLANVAKKIHKGYADRGLADDVDIEYVVANDDTIIIVQTRPKRSKKTTTAEGKTVIKVLTVDDSRVPDGTKIIQLDSHSQIAVQGAVASKLQIDAARDAKRCLPGRILVTHHTNNDYNTVFGSLDGVITTDGDQSSHAAQHAYEKGLPCVVGSMGALDLLMPFDGQDVTFDSCKKRVYIGHMPIIEEERQLDVWLTDEEEIAGFSDEGSRHENIRSWDISKRKRPKVFVEDPECHCRRRSNLYGYFQLDYFYRAWDRQAEILNRMFEGRRPWELKPQARQIKAIDDKHQLVHIVEDNDPASIYYFLMGVEGFGIQDLQTLFDARLDGFKRIAEFTRGLSSIDASNVELLADELLNVFSWMHFGFWLDSVVEEFAFEQLRYITNEGSFHNVLRDESVADLPDDYMVDPQNPDIPAGRILNLSREKEKEMHALLELIRSNPELSGVFESVLPDSMAGVLGARFPEVLRIIDSWSMKYKMTLEDLDVLSDTQEYLSDIQRRIRSGSSMNEDMLLSIYHAYLKSHGQDEASLGAIRDNDPNLYLLLGGFARSLAAVESGIPLSAIIADEIEDGIPKALARLNDAHRSGAPLREAARKVLEQYPEIKQVLAISKMQFPLREDAHHLIVPHQRKIAALMLEAARPFVPSVFERPEDVFNIGMEELVALLQEKDPGYVAMSLGRWRGLLDAELRLKSCWTLKKSDLAGICPDPGRLWDYLTYENKGQGYIDSRGFFQDKFRALRSSSEMELAPEFEEYLEQIFAALQRPLSGLSSEMNAFERATDEAVNTLETQINASTLPRVKEYYRAEQQRLRQRVQDLRSKLGL